ncbi:hypothetical protein [Lederbergia panacisoli]|uniref:hypothetical protein n=1 Tax=Lederbergia panacisoli TaxID=1255251 RepID=UPI00214C8C84|nr:hypothetical protein [Lederbergia panacisoli]MCR2820813.1 hypothetical protein [Lederbergia panacisoli]
MLTYRDVVKLYPNTKGVKVSTLIYRSLSFDSSIEQEKGLFIASNTDSNLLKAIGNGAVSTIWPRNIPIPAYTPNDFPVIYVDDSVEAMVKLVRKYTGKITLNKCGERAIMMFSEQNLQKDSIYYEIYCLLKENEVSKEMRNEGQ